MFYELAQLAIGNLKRARARLAMTAGGVVVGTSAVILLIALTIGLQASAERGLGENATLTELNVYPSWELPTNSDPDSKPPQLDIPAVNAFWRIPGVAAVIPAAGLRGGAEIRSGDYAAYPQIIGVDPSLLPYMGVTAAQGDLALEEDEGQIIVGAAVGTYFFDPEAEEWEQITVDMFNEPLRMTIWNMNGEQQRVDLVVRAVLAPGNSFEGSIIMPIRDLVALNEWINNTEFDPKTFTFDQITVRATSRETVNGVLEAIKDLGYQVYGMADYLNQLNQFFSTMRLMLGGVGGVALLVAAFGVANTMTMAILERTKEIGLMKAIGATDGNVLTVFLIEAGLVGFVGGVVGVLLSLGIQNLVNQAIANAPPPTDGSGGGMSFLPIDPTQLGGGLMIIPSELILFAIVLATSVGLFAGLYPALRAARMAPVLALKSE